MTRAENRRPLAKGAGNVEAAATTTATVTDPADDLYAWTGVISGAAQLGNIHATIKAKTTVDITVTVSSLAVVASAGIDVLGVRT